MLLLNSLLSFENVWPTLWISVDARLAPEFVLLWLAALVSVWALVRDSRLIIGTLSILYLALIAARYWDVTVPALFGRPVSLYWDGRELPRLLEWLLTSTGAVTIVVWSVMGLGCLWIGYRIVRAAVGILVREAAPIALGSVSALLLSAVAVAVVLANLYGVRATWPFVSKAVLPTYVQQASLLWTALSHARLESALPPSPDMRGDLAVLAGRDVDMFLLESYGAGTWDVSAIAAAVAPSREAFATAVMAADLSIVSAFVRAPTFAGGSGLSHMSLLSGIDAQAPSRYDLLLTSARPTLVHQFRAQGYRTVGIGIYSGERPEHAFYGFESLLTARDLDYRGPAYGPWKIPDQFAIARTLGLHAKTRDQRPLFLFFPTLASHLPFGPLPPVRSDWRTLLDAQTYVQSVASTGADSAPASGAEPDWNNLAPAYAASISYTFDWLTQYLVLPRERERVLILIGDHQPAASVVGREASWDVPVHIIARDDALISRLRTYGFVDGITPARPVIGRMHELTTRLLDAFSSLAL